MRTPFPSSLPQLPIGYTQLLNVSKGAIILVKGSPLRAHIANSYSCFNTPLKCHLVHEALSFSLIFPFLVAPCGLGKNFYGQEYLHENELTHLYHKDCMDSFRNIFFPFFLKIQKH